MAIVTFYEKPGCANNARQKQWLRAAGHELIVHDLLQQPWKNQADTLRSFFGTLPVAQWFNGAAPAIKSGRLQPEQLDEQQAIELMIADPLLIRRPLLEVDGQRMAGFEAERIATWLKMALFDVAAEACPKADRVEACKP